MPKTIKTKDNRRTSIWVIRPDETREKPQDKMPTLKELLKKKNIII